MLGQWESYSSDNQLKCCEVRNVDDDGCGDDDDNDTTTKQQLFVFT